MTICWMEIRENQGFNDLKNYEFNDFLLSKDLIKILADIPGIDE